MSPRLAIAGVEKSFGPTRALAGVDFTAEPGEVRAIVGENGAGKSTLMGILAGVVAPDAGSILVDGAPYRPRGPEGARSAGIAIVHQEPSLCPHLSVTENVLLGVLPTRFGFVDRRAARARVARAIDELGASLSPDARVAELGPGARQLVEIVRAIASTDARVLLLDEPTSSLARDDVRRLFATIRRLKARGTTVLYISHFLEEVAEISDTFTVLRDGRSVASGEIAGAALSDIVSAMAGRSVEELFPRTERAPGAIVLAVRGLAGKDKPVDASLELRAGEVLGVAGLVGAGRTELLRAIFGLDPVVRGTVRVGAYVGPASPARRLAEGMGLLSEDRKGEGLALNLSLADNLTMSTLDRLGPAGFVVASRQRRVAADWIERLAIRCRGPEQRLIELSGGNQQKVALARLLCHDVDVLLLDEPTRGIDVGSKAQIYARIDAAAKAGKAVLIVSSYLPELLGVCDRIAVMRRGALGPARPVAEWSEHAVLMEATGA